MIKSKHTVAVSASALLFLTACTDPSRFDPTAPDENQTRTGAIVGGITGAIAGIATSGDEDRLKGAIIGGAIGAGAGAAIGNQLDRQEADLRASLGNNQVDIVNTGSSLVVTMPQDILFPVDSATLRPDLTRDLGTVAGNLMAYPNSTVQIVGHTDNTGSAAYNQGLSQRRAEAVSQVLINNGVPAGRLQSIGRGEDAPVANNLTAEGRAQNRRVEIIISPNA
ncbi:MAG: OmpA family protein [Pseudomonadota bacterium]